MHVALGEVSTTVFRVALGNTKRHWDPCDAVTAFLVAHAGNACRMSGRARHSELRLSLRDFAHLRDFAQGRSMARRSVAPRGVRGSIPTPGIRRGIAV